MAIERIVLIEPRAPGLHVFSHWKLPRLGLPLLGAVLRDELGIIPTIYFQQISRLDWGEIGSSDLVGISSITSTAPEAYRILRKVKECGDIPVVFGGAHPTFLPDEALEAGADFVVRGEGEQTFPELIRYLNGDRTLALEEIQGLSFATGGEIHHNAERPRPLHLSELPWPDLSLIKDFGRCKIIPVVTSRGCPHACNFCSVTEMFGRRYRFRETEDIIAELKALFEANPKATVFFYDDNFTANRARTVELLERMLEEGLTRRWSAQARVDIARDPELLDLMKRSGCNMLYLGLESINPETLEQYHKAQTVEDVALAVKELHRRKIFVHGMFVIGSDADTPATVSETVRFAKKSRVDSVQFMILTPMPGTELHRELTEQERIFDHNWERYAGFHPVFYPRNMSPARLQFETMLRAYRKFYSVWQCWKMGLRFQWKDMAIRIIGHRMLVKWRQYNRDAVKRLKEIYRQEKSGIMPPTSSSPSPPTR